MDRVLVSVFLLAAGCGAAERARPATSSFELISAPELVAPVSSEYSEVRLAVSPDGDAMLWGSANRPGGPGSYDIWIVRRTAGTWSAPAPVSFNTDAKEFDPAFTHDGRHVYFFSNRAGGLGGDDIYRVPITPEGFGAVEHLDDAINSAGDEWAPAPMRDGTLLFASNGRGGRGRQDLFVASPRGAGFAPAEPLPGAINSAGDEFDATSLPDGGIVFSRAANIERDPVMLVYARRGPGGYDAGTLLPAPVNVDAGWTFGPAADWLDPSILYFTQRGAGSKPGTHEVFMVRYRVR
jgi:TolB protein